MPISPLLKSEINTARHDGIVATISRFNGTPPLDKLKDRFKDILTANPWIGAKLISTNDDEIACQTPEIVNDTSPFLEFFDIKDLLNKNANINNLIEIIDNSQDKEIINKLYPLSTKECINTDNPLIKFSLIEDKKEKEFAIIYSMNHIIGDGTSYYQLLSLLSFDEEIKPFNFERKLQFSRIEGEVNKFTSIEKQTFVKKINLELINKLKDETNENLHGEWVSTHDIINSLFFNSVKPDLAIFPVNARPHINYLDETDVGNYIKPIIISTENTLTAQDIRHAINKFRRTPEDNDACITVLSQPKAQSTKAVLTSWVQNYKQLSLGSECSYVAHYPLKPSYLHGDSIDGLDHIAVLFCLNASTWLLAGMTTNLTWLEGNILFDNE